MGKRRAAAALATAMIFGTGLAPAGAEETGQPGPSELQWGACPEGAGTDEAAQCADFEVPMDYSNPDGAKITLTMSRIPASGERKGVIVGNPGGPGGDALGMFQGAGDNSNDSGRVVLPEAVRSQYDQIAVEPRGLAFGTMLDCTGSSADMMAAAGLPAAWTNLAQTGGAMFEACERNMPGYAQHVTTDNTARDLEVARKALGEEKLNLYGLSYGSALMPTYATMFPEHTDHTIIDSPVSPQDRWFGLGATRKPIRAETLNAFFAWAAERDDEYHLGTTPLQVYNSWSDRVRQESGQSAAMITPPAAQRGDVPAEVPGGAEGSLGQSAVDLLNIVVPAMWRAGTFSDSMKALVGVGFQPSITNIAVVNDALYSQRVWPEVAGMIRDGVPAEAAEQPSEQAVENQTKMMLASSFVERAIICNENMNAPRTDLIAPTWITGLTGGDQFQFNEDWIASGQFCAGWPAPKPATQFTGEGLATKPLILGYSNDSAVGGAGVHDLQAQIGGEKIILDGYSHGVLLNETEKVAEQVTSYMNS